MAILNGTTKVLPKPHIEGVQTVVPAKITDPRLSLRVTGLGSVDSDLFQRHFHIILYYKKTCSEDSGWLFAGCGKESLGRALLEKPILAGRLRREESEGELEIVSNDSGARLIEARISVTLSEFLGLKDTEDVEAELVFWKDVDEQNPQFSPLVYIQVTNFQCGGYSIGISSSLLVANPLAIISFLKRWTKIHSNMVSKRDLTKQPVFYLPNLRSNISNPTNLISSNRIKSHNKPMIFRTRKINSDPCTNKKLVAICIEEAEREVGDNMPSKIYLLSETYSKEIKLEKFTRELVVPKFESTVTSVSWDDLGANQASFYEGNNPVCVSYWINSVPAEGLAILIVSPHEGDCEMSVIVSS